MANIRVKDLPNADTLADADEMIIDSSGSGTRRIAYSELKTEVAADYVAAPSTYKLATLGNDNRLTTDQIPDSISQGLNFVGNANSAGDLTSTTQGDFYVIQTAFGVYSVGDQAVYDGSAYVKVTDGTKQISEGGTGATSVDGAKTALQIINVGSAADEVSVNGMLGDMSFQSSAAVTVDDLTVDGQLTAAVGKPMPVNGPTMRFDGVDSEVLFAASVGSPFSFNNGTDDTAFAVAGWCKLASGWNTDQRTLLSKFDGNAGLREWRVYLDSNYRIYAEKRGNGSISANANLTRTISNVLSDIDDKWIHICVVYPPAGPSSADAFTDAKAYIYVNGKLNVDVQSEQPSGPYVGMTDTAGDVRIGSRQSADYWDGEIRDVKLFNKELSAAEVKEVYSNGSLGFAESTGAITYTSDFSAGVDGFVTYGGTGVGNIDGIGGKNDNLRFTIDSASANHQFLKNYDSLIEDGKSVRVSAEIYIPSTNAQITGVQVNRDGSANVNVIDTVTATNAWTAVSGVFTKDYADIRFRALNGTAAVFSGNGFDFFYVRNVRITQIGAVLDARAENYNQSAGKLLDVSGNDFVGTQTGGVELMTPRSHLSAGTLDLTNLPTSATGLSAGEVYNDSGTLKIV